MTVKRHCNLVSLALCFLLGLPGIAYSADTVSSIILEDSFEQLDLGGVLAVCPPDVQNPAPGDVRCQAGTAESVRATQEMRLYHVPLWAFLRVTNASAKERVFVLEHHLAITGIVTLQDLSVGASPVKSAGEAVSIRSRDYIAALPVFKIVLQPKETKLFRISIASDIVTRPGFTLYSQDRFFIEQQRGNLVHAFYYGLMLSMIFYNLILYLRLRSAMYLKYIFFILSLTVMYAGLYGHGYAFIWHDWTTWQKYSHSVAKFTAAIFGIAFFSAVLNVRTRMPRLFRMVRPTYLLMGLAALATPALSAQGIFLVATIVVAIAVVYSLALGILSVIGKLPFSIYYAIAMTSMLTGALINLLQTAAVLPSNTFTIHAMQVGTALETIFLSIALGDRYEAIENENRSLQLQRLEDKKRIARDIHDVVGTEFQMRLIEIGSDGESALSLRVSEGLRSTMNKIREFLFLLHTEENLPSNLEPNIRAIVARLEATKKYQVESHIRVKPGVLHSADAYHLERAVDEIVSNLARHAKASVVRFRLCVRERKGFLAVKDNGIGFDISAVVRNIGLESLQYRAERLGGKMRLVTKPGAGTTVAIRFKTQR